MTMYKAYLDRFTDNEKAVLLVDKLQQEFFISISTLPAGSIPGSWFLVNIDNGAISNISFDEEKTAEMKQEVAERMQRLKSKKSSRFKRK